MENIKRRSKIMQPTAATNERLLEHELAQRATTEIVGSLGFFPV
jgi:hypothetical protein